VVVPRSSRVVYCYRMNDEELKIKLAPEEYKVLREKGTEAPYSGKYYEVFDDGVYHCKVCNAALFASNQKYHSETPGLRGWPSFDDALPGAVEFHPDDSDGMYRTEVVCASCKSHLGHIFEDDDAKTGKHYCINSVCLELQNEQKIDL